MRNRRKAIQLILLMCAFLLLPAAAWGQAAGTLTGTILDKAGAAVAEATVVILNQATGVKTNAVTTSEGVFNAPNLPPGAYDISVAVTGFKEFRQTGVTIAVATTSRLDVKLELGSTSERVEVHADVSQLEIDTSSTGTSVAPSLITDLPLQVAGQLRSPVQFISLTPGFVGNLPNTPQSQLSFKINGGQEGGTDILIDGASISLAHPNLQMNYGVGVEAVAEFKVLTGSFPAQYGRATGGVVNLALKSGTNQLHGTGYEILRNKVLNANGWSNNYRGVKRGPDNQNDFGFQVAGPVYIPKLYNGKDKTFFMFNVEAYRYKQGGWGQTTVPNDSWNQGDFSNLLVPTTSFGLVYPAHKLYDYTTCTSGPCQLFPGNQIPMSRIDPVIKNAMQYFPKAQNKDVYNNFLNFTQNQYEANMWTGKIDEYFSEKHRVSVSWSHDNRPRTMTTILGPLFTSTNPTQKTEYARINDTYTISPTLLNYLNFGYSRTARSEINTGLNGDNWAGKLGLKGVSPYQFPTFLAGGVQVVPDSANSQFIDNGFQWNEHVAWSKGRHNMLFGVEHRRMQFNTPQLAYSSGRFIFNNMQTSDGLDSNTGFSYASLFLGAVQTAWIPTPQSIGMRTRYWSGFMQDDFKATSKLTFNFGLRYELATPVSEVFGRQSWMDPTVPNPGAGGLPGAYVFAGSGSGRNGLTSPQSIYKKGFGPRAGLAYAVNNETIVRMAYGIYYSPIIVNGFAQTDSLGFSNPYRVSSVAGSTQPVIIPGQMTGYPGALPPFINPNAANGLSGGQPSAILSDVAQPGRVQTWAIDIQRQITKDLMLDVAYVGAHGDHLNAYQRAPNQVNPTYLSKGSCLGVLITAQATDPRCAGQTPVPIPYPNFVSDWKNQATVAQALRPFPQYADFNLDNSSDANPFGFYTYNALQAKLQKRLSNGLTFMASYAWQKTLTNADGAYPPEGGWNSQTQILMQNNYNASAEKSLSTKDVPQWFVLSYSYDLPFGKGKKMLNNSRLANAVVGGWKISAIHSYQSGTPINVNCGGGYTSGLFNPSCRVNYTGATTDYTNDTFVFGKSKLFNPAAFTQPTSYTFGNASRMSDIRLPAMLNEDAALHKDFSFGERVSAALRVEAFNLFNRHRWGTVDNTVTSNNFGLFTGAGGNRTMQASLRFLF